jgi:predicted N-acetyltransferase YhbS
MSIEIRLEDPDDQHAVEELTREAFWKFWEPNQTICNEHFLVRKLRSVSSLVPELNFVASLDGRIVGHIIYTKSKIVDDSGKEFVTLTFGPLSVLPEYQNMGIGQMLMRYSFKEAQQLGYRAVLIFGHPDYYPRAGFLRAAEFGIFTSDGSSFDAFMAYPLYEGALVGVRGRYHIDPVYEQMTEEDTLTFDKEFPFKEPFVPTPVDVLLEQLEPGPRKALADTGCPSLQWMTSKSEREVAALPGMDEKAMETIRSVLHRHGIRWGSGKL